MALKLLYMSEEPEMVFDRNTVSVSESKTAICDTSYLIQTPPVLAKYATVERNRWRLDGSFDVFDTVNKVPYWSNQVSSDTYSSTNGYAFGTPITFTYNFEQDYMFSGGVSIISNDDAYPSRVVIKRWEVDDDGAAQQSAPDETFYPDSNNYKCSFSKSAASNRIEIVIYGMSKANRYLKLDRIVFGSTCMFSEDNIVSINLLKEISLNCTEIPMNSIEAEFNTKNNTALQSIEFKELDRLMVYRDSKLMGNFYISSAKNANDFLYDIQGYNFLYLMEKYRANPAIPSDASINEILNDYILYSTDAGTDMTDSIRNETADMYVYSFDVNARRALLELLSSTGYVYTIGDNDVLSLKEDFPATVKRIPEKDIFEDLSQNISTNKAQLVLRRQNWTMAHVDPSVGYSESIRINLTDDSGRLIHQVGDVWTVDFERPVFTPSIAVACRFGNSSRDVIVYRRSPSRVWLKLISFIPGGTEYGNVKGSPVFLHITYAENATEEIALTGFNTNLSRLYSAAKYIENNYFSEAADDRQAQRALKYYNNDASVSATIVIPDGLQCGDRIMFDTDKYNHFTGVVQSIEYTMLGGQKLIGKVTAHAYG